jgi:drug/metabolite transporter (DMT)-like permease
MTFGAWFFLLYPLKYIEPAIVSTITLGLGPIATIILGALIYKKESAHISDIFVSTLLFFVILYTIFLCFAGEALLQNVNKNTLILVIGSCFIVGFATVAGNCYTSR